MPFDMANQTLKLARMVPQMAKASSGALSRPRSHRAPFRLRQTKIR